MRILRQLTLLTLCLPWLAFAAPAQTMQLTKYYAAQCSSYTGTWRGFFTDPTDLFGNGGPWPVSVSLYNKDNNVIGKVSATKAPSYVAGTMKGQLWAQCKNGKLTHIFLGRPNQCGAYAQTGLLISKNVMVLEIQYQNAMTGAPFLLFLKRINNRFTGELPTQMSIPAPKTCH